MQAELIAVGTELLLGHTIDTDSAYASRELAASGIGVLRRFTVGDNPARLEETLRLALSRSDLVVLIGGLGPTKDDLTKEIAARVCGKQLVMHEDSRRRIEEHFRGRVCGETQWKQAMLPECSRTITAPRRAVCSARRTAVWWRCCPARRPSASR